MTETTTGWRPIAEAPKDGTDVILWAEAWEMSWGVQIGRFEGNEWHTAEGSVAENDDDFDPDADVEFDEDEDVDWDRNSGPTHFMPVPAPPSRAPLDLSTAVEG